MFASKDLFLTRPSGYQISRSVRLRSSASAYFSRTPASAGNRQVMTFSWWMKLGNTAGSVFGAPSTTNPRMQIYYNGPSDGRFELYQSDSGGAQVCYTLTTARYRDPSAWYHFVIAIDTTQATASNRIKWYVNGVQLTAFDTAAYPAQNTNMEWNAAAVHNIGRQPNGGSYFDGYLTEINFIDGQALTPSSFGSTNSVTGVWQPIKYAGTYGTNGFYLNFSDNSNNTATTIGKDYSGNGNNWTPNNISVTSGVTYDSMLDVPTLYADGGNGRGNYCVLNPLDVYGITVPTLQAANLEAVFPNADRSVRGSLGISSGKWYFEFTCTNVGGIYNTIQNIGVAAAGVASGSASSWLFSIYDGNKVNTTSTAYGTGTGSGAVGIVGVAVDMDNGKIWWSRNGTFQASGDPVAGTNAAFTSVTGTVFPFLNGGGGGYSGTSYLNFGQRPFTYTPPTGFVALNTQNLPTPTISNGATVMAASTYTGTGATQTIANSGNNAASISFKPDWVWIKSRSAATNNNLFDSVRGTTNYLISNSTAIAATNANTLTAFSTTGFTLGSDASALGVNVNAATYVAWQWQAGQGSTSSNTSGSITSTVSVNATAGFSVVTYTGTGANATVGHGLGVAPRMIFIKSRTLASDWVVYHASIGNTGALILNQTIATSTSINYWNNTSPTSSVFTIGIAGGVNNSSSDTYVAYCFAAVAGYSAFGSYTGNGSADGVFVYLGFRARFLMIKRTDGLGGWVMLDTSRDPYNIVGNYLYANSSAADAGSSNVLDINSNGFKIRNSWTDINASGGTYVYMAFAENPFKLSLAR